MNETEKYLNSILNKRLGSVVNQSAYANNASTVARIPLQEEEVAKMPTVFRKKHETVVMEQKTLARDSLAMSVVEEKVENVEKDQDPI